MWTAGVRSIVEALTLDEKAALTAGADLWSTVAIPRAGLPAVGLTDGPNGARGRGIPGAGSETSACTPCGSALGATWDPDLVARVAGVIGREARVKRCHVLLAPTVNLHRSPLGGRTFEAFSEDPLLAGRLAAGFVQGAQAEGVAATVKHFVANETEFERLTVDTIVDERTLRELYLVPFELAVRDGRALAIMTAYNRLNGTWCSEHPELYSTLRDEWGFDGLVMTDWFAGAHTVGAAEAGLDLEMPGPGRAFGPSLADAVRAGAVDEKLVDEKVGRILSVLERLGVLGDGSSDAAPRAAEPQPGAAADVRAVLREAASGSMVLLRNTGVLPLDLGSVRSIALIGPNASRAQIAGGGSSQVLPQHRTSPLDALRSRFGPRLDVRYERGCDIDIAPPVLSGSRLRAPDGSQGVAVEWFAGNAHQGTPRAHSSIPQTMFVDAGPPRGAVEGGTFSLRATTYFAPLGSGVHHITFSQAGRGRLLVDGVVVADGTVDPPPPGRWFYGMGSIDLDVHLDLSGGREHEIVVELTSIEGAFLTGFRVGCRLETDGDPIDRAVEVASASDVAIVVVGTNDDWESEGSDRDTLDLPGDQDELVRRVAAVNPRTVVVVNAGSPVTMPWADEVPAVLYAWFGGQEMSDALVDVLVGDADPGGRLPTTIPMRIEHTPAYGSFHAENHVVRYGEGIFMGYRWYDARHIPTRYAFGHGLSYADFEFGPASLSSVEIAPGEPVVLRVPVVNVGRRAGSTVVQCYVAPVDPPVARPPKELKAFAKVHLEPGARADVVLELEGRSFAYWHTGDGAAVDADSGLVAMMDGGVGRPSGIPRGWHVAPGVYDLFVATSSVEIVARHRVSIAERATRPTTSR